MGTKTIGLQDDAYERLKARKREGESFTDLVERLLEETTTHWQEGFGTLPATEMDELEATVAESHSRTDQGLADRQRRALDAFTDLDEETDETA
jgi:predicted CopG family antitoxin